MKPDPLVGTWKLNVAKSKQAGPGMRYKEWTHVYEEQEGQLVGAATQILEDGSIIHSKYTVSSTGGTVHFSEGALPEGVSMTLSPRSEDSHTADWPVEMGGRAIAAWQDVVSSDGKTLTVTARGNDAKGKPYEAVLVFDRQ